MYIGASIAIAEAVLLTLVSHPRALWANAAAVGGHCQWAYAQLWWACLRRCWPEAIAGDLGLCSVAAVEPASWHVHDPRRSQCSADLGACDWSYPSEHDVPKSDLQDGEREGTSEQKQQYDREMVPPTQTAIGCLAVATDMPGAVTWPGGAAQKTHELILAC